MWYVINKNIKNTLCQLFSSLNRDNTYDISRHKIISSHAIVGILSNIIGLHDT